MLVGATLKGREHGIVDLGLKATGVLPEEDDTSPGATEGLVGGGGNNISVLEGVRSLLGSDETTEMGHIHHQQGTVGIGDGAEAGVVPVVINPSYRQLPRQNTNTQIVIRR